jgi:hypothetical protein
LLLGGTTLHSRPFIPIRRADPVRVDPKLARHFVALVTEFRRTAAILLAIVAVTFKLHVASTLVPIEHPRR